MPSKLVFVIASEEQTKPKLLAERKEKLSLINKQLDARQSFDLSQLPEKVNKCSSAVHKLYGYDFLSPETFFSLFSLSAVGVCFLLLVLSDRDFSISAPQLHISMA